MYFLVNLNCFLIPYFFGTLPPARPQRVASRSVGEPRGRRLAFKMKLLTLLLVALVVATVSGVACPLTLLRAPRVYTKTGTRPRPAIISVCTITMDYDAIVCFITDRFARG